MGAPSELEGAATAAKPGPQSEYFSLLGAQYQLEARLRWLAALRAAS